MAQAGPGKIRLWNDFCGPEIPIANIVAYGTTAGGCTLSLGDYSVKGEIEVDDSGAVYPVTIDPTVVHEDTKLTASDAAGRSAFSRRWGVSLPAAEKSSQKRSRPTPQP